MTIKAILKNGVIEPVEPLPPEWSEGQELIVEHLNSGESAFQFAEWERELDEGVKQISREDHERFLGALDGIETESKDDVRREWNLP